MMTFLFLIWEPLKDNLERVDFSMMLRAEQLSTNIPVIKTFMKLTAKLWLAPSSGISSSLKPKFFMVVMLATMLFSCLVVNSSSTKACSKTLCGASPWASEFNNRDMTDILEGVCSSCSAMFYSLLWIILRISSFSFAWVALVGGLSCLSGNSAWGFSTFCVVLLKTRPLLVTQMMSVILTKDGKGSYFPSSIMVALYLYGITLLVSYGIGPGR